MSKLNQAANARGFSQEQVDEARAILKADVAKHGPIVPCALAFLLRKADVVQSWLMADALAACILSERVK